MDKNLLPEKKAHGLGILQGIPVADRKHGHVDVKGQYGLSWNIGRQNSTFLAFPLLYWFPFMPETSRTHPWHSSLSFLDLIPMPSWHVLYSAEETKIFNYYYYYYSPNTDWENINFSVTEKKNVLPLLLGPTEEQCRLTNAGKTIKLDQFSWLMPLALIQHTKIDYV